MSQIVTIVKSRKEKRDEGEKGPLLGEEEGGRGKGESVKDLRAKSPSTCRDRCRHPSSEIRVAPFIAGIVVTTTAIRQ